MSRDGAVTCLRCGGIFIYYSSANLVTNLASESSLEIGQDFVELATLLWHLPFLEHRVNMQLHNTIT